ncbi:N-acetyltransferase [Desulforamulus ferrireducens]|uniref:N-acetyltransferase n=1 Tax=Desulforamulus ferrireducens TaxID=1833852 RepID=A0A1S6IV06_9FIRM|nr:N-acetyltransferase [Desulforamulus ferrireducens]
MVQIVKVSEPHHWHCFFEFPRRLYFRDPLWTPLPLSAEQQLFNPQTNPVLRHVNYECFLALDKGSPVGRIAAITDDLLPDQRIGLFGCFETVNNSEVVEQLLKAVAHHLKSKGKQQMQGPVTMNTSQQVGLLVEGFHLPPQAQMPYNPPYYGDLLEQQGCSQLLDLYSYLWDPGQIKALAKLKAIAKRAAKIPGIRFRTINLNDPWGEGKRFAAIYNQTMTNQWGFVPMDQTEAAAFLAGLRGSGDPELLFYCEVKGEAVGVCLMMPDVGPELRAARRFGFAPLLPLPRSRKLRVGVLAVVPEYRRRGVVALLLERALQVILRKGYRQAELSLIMASNKEMNSIINNVVGNSGKKVFRIYQKPIE